MNNSVCTIQENKFNTFLQMQTARTTAQSFKR